MSNSKLGPIAAVVGAVLTIGGGVTASAQSADSQPQESGVRALEEVTVTATRREESALQVPISLTALSGAALENMGAGDFQSYVRTVPNLSFASASRVTGGAPAIRGIAQAVGDALTAMYVDETPVTSIGNINGPLPPLVDPNLYDIERIEVLRGPQGTLFGARSMGGALRVITRGASSTTFESSAAVDVSTTAHGGQNYRVDGMVNLPLVEGVFGARFVGTHRREDGFIDLVPPESFRESFAGFPCPNNGAISQPCDFAQPFRRENINSVSVDSLRAVLSWQVSDNLSADLRIWAQQSREDGQPSQDVGQDELTIARIAPYLGFNEFYDDAFQNHTLTVRYDLGSGLITSNTSYWDRKVSTRSDWAGFGQQFVGEPVLTLLAERGGLQSLTQEIRYQSQWAGRFQLLAGGFYSDKDMVWAQTVQAPGLHSLPQLPPFAIPGYTVLYASGPTNAASNEEVAAFADGRLTFGALTFSAGVRWSDYEEANLRAADGLLGYPAQRLSSGKSKVQSKADVVWSLREDASVYARIAEGYRPGFSTGVIFPATCRQELIDRGIDPDGAGLSISPDSLISYEVGAKARFFDGRVSAEASAFRVTWQDIAVQEVLDCGFPVNSNAAEARIEGAEIELRAALGQSWDVGLSGGYTRREVTKAVAGSGGRPGDSLPGVPDVNGSAFVQYSFPLLQTGDGHVRLSYEFVDDVALDFAEEIVMPSYGTLGLRLGVSSGPWTGTFYINNVTDERGLISYSNYSAFLAPTETMLTPRTIGLRVTRMWGEK